MIAAVWVSRRETRRAARTMKKRGMARTSTLHDRYAILTNMILLRPH